MRRAASISTRWPFHPVRRAASSTIRSCGAMPQAWRSAAIREASIASARKLVKSVPRGIMRMRGAASGYFFVFAERDGSAVAYSCYGPIACTISSFDVFWIAVHRTAQKEGLGKRLMTLTERLIHDQGGQRCVLGRGEHRLRSEPGASGHGDGRCGWTVDGDGCAPRCADGTKGIRPRCQHQGSGGPEQQRAVRTRRQRFRRAARDGHAPRWIAREQALRQRVS